MPLKLAKLVKTVSLAPETVSGATTNAITHYVLVVIVALLFLFDLIVAGYSYLILKETNLPGFVVVTGGAIVAWAFTSLGITSSNTLTSNSLATAANTAATAATVAPAGEKV